MKDYNKSNIKIAKILRKNMTRHERKLWYLFLREYPVRFQRQKAIDNYIADFYCAKAKLIIELDGSGHYEPYQMLKDRIRTERLEEMDLTVIRICNLDIDRNFYNVCEYIDTFVKNSLPQSSSMTAPSSDGAES
ncbi:MAG: endonuclease domain-containing protein [Clostridia bacterium]|nr:endonuclease domain-containing protein [Clostridia bacterium]